MARIDGGGIGIEYEIIGDGHTRAGRTVAITPGGRFSKDSPGIRQLAERLAAAGNRVLIWDRPNCGASDICFDGETESYQNADALGGLLRALDFGPTYLIGGSGGSRDSLLTAIRHPDVVRRLFLLWISGGAIGLTCLPYHYCHGSAVAASAGGMEAVANLPEWQEAITRNPGNRARILAWEVPAFIAKMQDWAQAFTPQAGAPLPGVTLADLAAVQIPVMVLRSGVSDVHHTRATSEALSALLPNARLGEPPWGDREWIDALIAAPTGRGLFTSWPMLADQVLEFEGQA